MPKVTRLTRQKNCRKSSWEEIFAPANFKYFARTFFANLSLKIQDNLDSIRVRSHNNIIYSNLPTLIHLERIIFAYFAKLWENYFANFTKYLFPQKILAKIPTREKFCLKRSRWLANPDRELSNLRVLASRYETKVISWVPVQKEKMFVIHLKWQ